MKKYIVLDKPIGQTPLEAVTAWKTVNPLYTDIPASYAGRLDPMASGKLLVLLGEECKKQKVYTGLDKEYEIEILLDVGSDTGDALGITEYAGQETRTDDARLASALAAEKGTHERTYPIYSSKTVQGVPLFLHALRGTLKDIEMPVHQETIYRIELRDIKELSAQALQTRIETFLTKVPRSNEPSKELGADFRIQDVTKSWQDTFSKAGNRNFYILRLGVVCGSGAYMRSLAGRIGEALGTKGLALSIERTRIGTYRFGIWWKSF